MKQVCVFGASGCNMEEIYFAQAREFGRLIAERGMELVFGGGDTGLMGAVARGVKECGGRVTGIIPEKLNVPGIPYPHCDLLIVTKDMHERKARMEEMSDAYVALPGGFGTLEELMEVLTLNQLGYISAPVVILNTCGFYDALLHQLDCCAEKKFANPACLRIFQAADTARKAADALTDFTLPALPNKIKEALKQNGNDH